MRQDERSLAIRLDDVGYVVAEGILDPEGDLEPLLDEYRGVLDRLAESLYDQGRIGSMYAELPLGRRLIQVTREAGRSLSQHFDMSLPQSGIRSDTPLHLGPACFRVLTNRRLLDLAQEIVGPEMLVSPVGHVRMKLPERTLPEGGDGLMAKVPWHQDNGVVLEEADRSDVLTVWVPINQATIDNGCMQVLPTGRAAELVTHCPSAAQGAQGAHIPDRFVDQARVVRLPMKPGSVLLMHPRTLHSSLANVTDDQVRISMDLRYQPMGQATGRPMFPAFVARSRARPETELRDPHAWAEMWLGARRRLARDQPSAFNRWDASSPACA